MTPSFAIGYNPTVGIGVLAGLVAFVPSSGALGAVTMRRQPGLAFEVLIDRLAVAADALTCEQGRDAPITVAGRTLGQNLLDGSGQLWPPQRAGPTRLTAIIEPTAGHAEGTAGQRDRSVEWLGQTYYIPSGNRSSLSSQNFFKMSTSGALRPKARSSSSILRGSGSRRLWRMSSPWSLKPRSSCCFQR